MSAKPSLTSLVKPEAQPAWIVNQHLSTSSPTLKTNRNLASAVRLRYL